jgi:hypothetical protein
MSCTRSRIKMTKNLLKIRWSRPFLAGFASRKILSSICDLSLSIVPGSHHGKKSI